MQYLKVQYARTDVLAKTAETHTKESRSSSASFQSLLESMQEKPDSPKIEPGRTTEAGKKSADEGVNAGVEREQQKNVERKTPEPVKSKKDAAEAKKTEEAPEAENDENQVYMIIDLSAAEVDGTDALKNLEFAEAQPQADFIETAETASLNAGGVPEDPSFDGAIAESGVLINKDAEKTVQASDDKAADIPVAAEAVALSDEGRTEEKAQVPFRKAEVREVNAGETEESRTPRKVFEVFDERTVQADGEAKKAEPEGTRVKAEVQNSQNFQAAVASDTARADILSTNDQSAAASGSTFQQMLSSQIQMNAPEFAKAGSIILKDQNSGSINMILKPETLGNVKISLQLSDKNISGHIVVQSKEAMDAFKENLDLLRQSFRESGFENAQLSLSLADSSSGNQFAHSQGGNDGQYVAGRAYKEYGQSGEAASVSSDSSQYSSSGEYQIDVVA